MKKSFFIILLFGILGVVVALPYWFGTQAEAIYNSQIGYLRAANKLDVTNNKFQRGFLQSSAEAKLAIPSAPVTITAEHIIEHGPFPMSKMLHHISNFEPVQALIHSKINMAMGEQVPINGFLDTLIDIYGVATTHFNLPAQQAELSGKYAIDWNEITGSVKLGSIYGALRGSAKSDGARLGLEKMNLTLGPSNLRFETSVGHNDLLIGTSILRSEAMAVEIEYTTPETTTISGLTLQSKADELGASISYELDGRFQTLTHNQITLGPGKWDMAARKLDSPALVKLRGRVPGEVLPINALIDLVTNHNAELVMDLDITTESGPVSAKANLGFDSNIDISQPLLAFLALQGSVTVEAPTRMIELVATEIVKQDLQQLQVDQGVPLLTDSQLEKVLATAVPQRIQSWVESNYLVRQGDKYMNASTLENGSLRINDKPVDFVSMLP